MVKRPFVRLLCLTAAIAVAGEVRPAHAQSGRVLGRDDILLYGIGLKVEPAHQTVPKDIATIVSTFMQAPTLPEGLPPFAPDAEVRATLRGPSFARPIELRGQPNTPLNIPPLSVSGIHTVENIRVVSGGNVLLRGTPEHVTIDVIERLLVTQVTARALTADEIREKGIVFDRSNFQAYNFSAAFAVADQPITINFPVLLPKLEGAAHVPDRQADIPSIPPPPMPTLQTIIPDTLKLQAMIPNLSVVGFTLKVPEIQGQNLIVPPIPGVVVIPGDIGFLNQYFSVMLMVGNVAPTGSNLVVTDLTADIVLPPGRDGVVDSSPLSDDPLRMAQTARGPSPRTQTIAQPGADGRLGTADDILTLAPGESGNAEYLVEGRREGSHVVEMRMSGTLLGLPGGPVPITGVAAGSVLVRNPTFTLTFTHPEVVNTGEAYTLDVTVTNTSQSPANFVSLTLYPRNVSGATIVGSPTQGVDSIAPGDSATVTFDLVSRVTGKVTAATLDSDEKVAGRFELKTAVGELGVPLSPDSLILPREASSLPKSLRDAALGLLGRAHAVATSPAAALPADIKRMSRKIVIDRAIEVAEAGLRVTLHEPLPDSAAQLLMDFMGSNVTRLPGLVDAAALPFEQQNFDAFDDLRRRSVRGDVFANAVGALLHPQLTSLSAAPFHAALASRWSYRPAHVSVLLSAVGSSVPVRLVLLDNAGRKVGAPGQNGKILKESPYSDYVPIQDATGNITAYLAVLAAPEPGNYTIQIDPIDGVAPGPFSLSIVAPAGDGLAQHTLTAIDLARTPASIGAPADQYRFTFSGFAAGSGPNAVTAAVVNPAPTVLGVVQQLEADQLTCDPRSPGVPAGRVVAVLFSEEITRASAQDRAAAAAITNFQVDSNQVVGVALQPGRRIAFIALRDSVGPFIERHLTVTNVQDLDGNTMAPWTGPIEITVNDEAGIVSGRVLNADGTPVEHAAIRLFYLLPCIPDPVWVGVSAKNAAADGSYSWDYVLKAFRTRIVAIDPDTEEFRKVHFNVQRPGQQLNVNVIFLGRGTFSGRTFDEQGRPLRDTYVKVTSLTDHSVYGARTDAEGRFTIARVPVGNLFVEAVNLLAKAEFSLSELMPFAGAVVVRDMTLLDVEQRDVVVKHGAASGFVLREDGVTPVAGLPVYAYYQHLSQPNLRCPGNPPPVECAVAVSETNGEGKFSFAKIPSGDIRLATFDAAALSQGEARIVLAADGAVQANILLSGGLGTVSGVVRDADNNPVAGAQVGGGLSLTTTAADGTFTLTDVPVGRREIVAVSQALSSMGRVTVDIVRAGQTVGATIILDGIGTVSGTVLFADGRPVPNNKVYLFEKIGGRQITVVGSATTDAAGAFTIANIKIGEYILSAFDAGFTDGNVVPVALKFNNQHFRATIRFRGGAGKVTGVVFDDDGKTPLKARVGISGDRVLIAGGMVGVGFEHVNNFRVVDTDFTTGRFGASGILVGPFTVTAVGQFSPDPITVEAVMPSPGATVDLELKLQPTSQIAGTVLLPNGLQPAPQGVIVKYKSEAYKVICSENGFGERECQSIPQGIQEENAITDAFGRFWFPVVNAGPFTITVEEVATGRVGRLQGHVRAGEKADLSVRLLAQGDLTITVLGRDGTGFKPVPNAMVDVEQLSFPKKKLTRQADGTGTVLLTGGDAFTEGEVVIAATNHANGFSGRASAVIKADGEPASVTVYLYDEHGSVTGTVLSYDGFTPVPNAEVIVSNAAGPLAFAVTDANGSYSVDIVPLGPLSVDVFEAKTGRRGAATGAIAFHGQTATINVVEATLGLVQGIVYEAGGLQPLKGWQVTLNQRSATGIQLPSLRTTTALDGTYFFPGTSRGTFTLLATKRDTQGSGTGSGAIDQEGEIVDVPILVDIVRPLTGTISGIAYLANGQPAANARIEICHPQKSCATPEQLTAGVDGTFSLPDVPLGRFTVIARSQTSGDAGNTVGELSFDGDVAYATVVMSGIATVEGVVEFAAGGSAAGVKVTLQGQPTAGCGLEGCVQFADASGRFEFVNVPARTFTALAYDVASGLKGSVGGGLNPGEQKQVRIVLEPTAPVSGRVRRSNGDPAQGVIAELIVMGGGVPERRLYQETAADGTFSFDAVPLLNYQLKLSDPIGPGEASRAGTVAGPVTLGDISLDEAAPQVAALTPAPSSTGVDAETAVTIVFSEPILPGTIDQQTVVLSGPAGPMTASRQVIANDTTVVVTPLAKLSAETKYTIQVKDVEDRVGKPMVQPYVASFTTQDIAAPTLMDASPAAGIGGVSLVSPIRLKFSEPIDVAALGTAPLTLAGPEGSVAGATAYLFGNTVIVFTPAFPLDENTTYQVSLPAVKDLSGNMQASGTAYAFSTTDRTPPVLSGLSASNNGTVIENGESTVEALAAPSEGVLFVDFYLNGVLAFTDRASPFAITFRATPDLGVPGSQIAVSAIATDFSGNRGTAPIAANVTVTADQPPVVNLAVQVPGGGTTPKNGDRILVTVTATDDLSLTQAGYRALTGNPADALTRPVSAASFSETFAFHVPTGAAPGAPIIVQASAIDSKGQVAQATPVELTVVDSVAPVVQITGTTSGGQIRPGQKVTVVLSAQDLGGISQVQLATSDLVTSTQERTIEPAQNAVLTSFSVDVPQIAAAGQTLVLDATARDRAGNLSTPHRVILEVADDRGPTVTVQTASGAPTAVIGRPLTLLVHAEDSGRVAQIDLIGSGAFSFTRSSQVTPPVGSADASFEVNIDPSLPAGSVLTVRATATDVAGNVTAPPVSLDITLTNAVSVTLPPSAIVKAGAEVDVLVTLGEDAPPSGVRLDFSVENGEVAVPVPAWVTFAAGEREKTIKVAGLSGGTTGLHALLGGVQRASMTVTVAGGVVSGTVYDSLLTPTADVQVTVRSGFTTKSAVTDQFGRFEVQGMPGPNVSVKALHPVTRLYGFSQDSMARVNGFIDVPVVLISAGSIRGNVLQADASTPAGPAVRVDIFQSGGSTPLATTFTDENSEFSFPLVTLGQYTIRASATDGSRGLASAQLAESGAEVVVPVTFIGLGKLRGTVSLGGVGVPNAELTLRSWTSLGTNPTVETTADQNGMFDLDVEVGQFSLDAVDPVTKQAGSIAGTIQQHGHVLQMNVPLESYASLEGTIYRADGTTVVVGAAVTASTPGGAGRRAVTNELGRYRFDVLPLGTYSIHVSDPGTRGSGSSSVTLAVHRQTAVVDISLVAQGGLLVTVQDSAARRVPGASVTIGVSGQGQTDAVTGSTGPEGTVLFERVLAGSFNLTASFGRLSGYASGTISADALNTLTVSLEPTGTIQGTVYEPDAQTPVSGGTIAVERYGPKHPIGPDGTYEVQNVPLGTYRPVAFDTTGRERAATDAAQAVVLASNGQVAIHDMVMVGLGTVHGQVLLNGVGVSGFTVSVRSFHPQFGSTRTAQTNGGGFYTVSGVAIGPFTASTGRTADKLLGEASGTLTQHGESVQADIVLKSNAINLPVDRYDGNNYRFNIQRNGSISTGSTSFGSTSGTGPGANVLVIADADTGANPATFPDISIGTVEDSSREIAVTSNDVRGLQVTRKMYVPLHGYFGRQLELITNPSPDQVVSVSIRVTHKVRPNSATEAAVIDTTSSGDQAFEAGTPDTADRWVVFRNFGHTGTSGVPARAFVVAGPGGQQIDTAAVSGTNPTDVSFGWSRIDLQPGETVGLLHYMVQQTTDEAARLSAERLVQGPPEALAGLSLDEIAAVRNFQLPEDGRSVLTALPQMAGTVTGTVFDAGSVIVPSATVYLRSTVPYFQREYSLNASVAGAFTFTTTTTPDSSKRLIPVAPFILRARFPGTLVESPLVPADFNPGLTTATVNIQFTTTAVIEGVVRLHGGAVVTDGTVNFSPGSLSATIGTDGKYRRPGLAPGTYAVRANARHPQGSSLSLTTTVTVAAGEVLPLNFDLAQTFTLSGTVSKANSLPAAGVTVKIDVGSFSRSTTTDTSGNYTLTQVPPAQYRIRWTETRTQIEATDSVAIVDADVTKNLTVIAVGSVKGVVRRPGGAVVPSQSVSLRATRADGTTTHYSVTTNTLGEYRVDNVAASSIVASTSISAEQLYAEAFGAITAELQELTLDLNLLNNSINLPVTLYDANSFPFDLQNNGSSAQGINYVFGGTNYGATRLEIVNGGVTSAFTGSAVGTHEDGRREIAIRQTLGSVNVTRKIFVPERGYFARYLEVLSNVGTQDVTLDLRIKANNGALVQPCWWCGYTWVPLSVRNSSSGDATIGVDDPATADRWVVLDDDTDADPFLNSGSLSAVAFAFDGVDAAERAAQASYSSAAGPGVVTYGWNNITIPPGGRVAYMHFVVQQTGRVPAQASAERLVQLPPEAIEGLADEERVIVRNFAVPAVSTLEPLPSVQGTVNGRVMAGGGTLAVPGAAVSYRSTLPLFGRTFSATSDATGAFTFASDFSSPGSSRPIPVYPYTVSAVHPLTSAVSPAAGATFGEGSLTSDVEARFDGTGSVAGVLRRSTGAGVPNVAVSLGSYSATTAADGSFAFTGLAPQEFALSAAIYPVWPQSGTALTASATAVVTANSVTAADLTFPPAGALTGTIRSASGQAVGGGAIRLENDTFSYATIAAANGTFIIDAVVTGGYTLEAVDPRSTVSTTMPVTIVPDSTVTQDVTLPGVGLAQVQVTFARGVPAAGAPVHVRHAGTGSSFTQVGTSDASGRITVPNIPVGPFEIRAGHPLNTSLTGTSPGEITAEAHSIDVAVTLPAAGTVSGRVTYPNGSPVQYHWVQLRLADSNGYLSTVDTDADGRYTMRGVPAGIAHWTATQRPGLGWWRFSEPFTLTADDQTHTADMVLPALAALRLRVSHPEGGAWAGLRVHMKDAAQDYFTDRGVTNAAGELLIAQVPEGQFRVRLFDSGSGILLHEIDGVIQLSDDATTVDFPIVPPVTRGTIEGHVFASDGVAVLPGISVKLLNVADNKELGTATSDAAGRYEFAGVMPGAAGFVISAVSPYNTALTATVTGVFSTAGEVLTKDIVLPVTTGTITGRITMSDGSGAPGVLVRAVDAQTSIGPAVTTDADGRYTIANVMVGGAGFRVIAAAAGLQQTVSGGFAQSGETRTIDLQLAVTRGSAIVRATAADGITLVRGASVTLYTTAGVLFASLTATDGTAQFTDRYLPADGFTARASFYNWPEQFFASADAASPSTGGSVDVTLVFQVSVITGQVTFADGTPVQYPDVFVMDANGVTRSAASRLATGQFTVFGTAPGDFEITAQDSGTQLIATAAGRVESIDVAVLADVRLPATGTVTGRLLDEQGNAIPGKTVGALSALNYERYAATNDSGVFTLTSLPEGAVTLFASPYVNGRSLWSSATGTVVANSTVTIDLVPVPFATITGRVLSSDGATVLMDSWVGIDAFGGAGPHGHFSDSLYTASGAFTFTGVPAGAVKLVAYDPSSNVGMTQLVLGADTTTTADVRIGTAVELSHTLQGTDGFRYTVSSSGGLNGGGLASTPSGARPFSDTGWLDVNDSYYCCIYEAAVDANGRQITLGPLNENTLTVTRKVFVPEAGGFARYLDIIENPTGVPVPLEYFVGDSTAYSGAARFLFDPANTGNTFALVDNGHNSAPTGPVVGFVFAGEGDVPMKPRGFVTGRSGQSDLEYQWNTTIPAGGKIAFLRFVIQRDPSAAADAEAQARALVALTDPNALAALTDEEKSMIRNFIIPAPPAGGNPEDEQ